MACMTEGVDQLLPHRQWLQVNWDTLVKANIPAMKIADKLVPSGVYDPCDEDYQRIETERTTSGKVRILLETMYPKSSSAFDLFQKSLSEVCPHVLKACNELPHALSELASVTRSHYQSSQGTRALFLNLSMVEKTIAEGMMSSLASNSDSQINRQDYVYSRPAEQDLVRLDNLFPRFRGGHACWEQAAAAGKSQCFEVATSADAMHAQVARSSASNDSAVFLSDGEDAPSSSGLQSAKRVAIYGGAGCGKTSCLLKAAGMYADKQLWPGARAFLLWRLRDPKVQNADNLKQLLRQLKLDLPEEKYKSFADVLDACDGEEVLLALDGVDELDTQKSGFIWSLLDGSALSKACILATSRPSSIAKGYFDEYGLSVELLGFSEEQVDEFVKQQFADKPELAERVHDALLDNPTLTSLMMVPLLALIVCQVFCSKAEKPPATKTALYSMLLTLVVRRTVEMSGGRLHLPAVEISSVLEASDVFELSDTPRKLLCELAELASQAHEQGKAVFDHAFVKEASCSDQALELGLVCGYSADQGLNVVRQYSFQHVTVQDFLVAYRRAAHIASWEELSQKVSVLTACKDNHTALQFFAGLLAERLRPHLFVLLNQWLHEGYDPSCDKSRHRLRVCLQCAHEACNGEVKGFPSTLQLPEGVVLEHVTAADVTLLALALEKSEHIKWLSLRFDEIKMAEKTEKMGRVKTHNRQAVTKLMFAISRNKSLRYLTLYGPKYSLLEEEGWQLLVKAVQRDLFVLLAVVRCKLNNASFHLLSSALRHNTQLTYVSLFDNSLNDASVCTLARDLKHNNTLQGVNLRWNSYGEETHRRLRQQLKHIKDLDV